MNGYELSREWFDWAFENPDKAKPSHASVYFWMIELCNRLSWKTKFGIPTLHAMEATGIKSKNTYYKAFHDLKDWGFIEVIELSKNQNSANIISICAVSKNKSASKSALDLAVIQHEFSGGNVDKPLKPLTKKPESGKRALNFLKTNYQSRIETDFLLKYASKIENKEKFRDDFNDTVDQEGLEYTDKILFARLGKYARNWIENQQKFKSDKTSSSDVDNFYKNIPVG